MRHAISARAFAMALAIVVATVAGGAFVRANAGEIASVWQSGHNVRTRVVAGIAAPGHAGLSQRKAVAGLVVVMAPGWKTYWRNPGDAGGVPPFFSFEGSANLAAATPLYPAPKRLADASGEAIGYKGEVVFPIVLTATDPGKPITLKVRMEYGVCREICIPAEAAHELTVPAGVSLPVPPELASALASVPVVEASDGRPLPKIEKVNPIPASAPTRIEVDVVYPAGGTGADMFVEAPDSLYVALPKRLADPTPGVVRYAIELGSAAEAAAFKGRTLAVTLVQKAGSRATEIRLP